MNLFNMKATAYLIDRIIMLDPKEVVSLVDESPEFANGRRLFNFSYIKAQNLSLMGKLFGGDSIQRVVNRGYKGISVKKDTDNNFYIEIYGDKETCGIINKKLPLLKKLCSGHLYSVPIFCKETNNINFANASNICSGGSCILQPNGVGQGVLGAWIRRINSNMPVGITNNHVAVENNVYPSGTMVINQHKDVIGEVEGFIPLKEYKTKHDNNLVDLAWINPSNLNTIDFSFSCGGTELLGEIDLEENFDNGIKDIYLCSNASTKNGYICGIAPSLYVGHNPKFRFIDVIEVDIGKVGDSGAIITDSRRNIGGLFFAYSDYHSLGFVNKWEYVRAKSKIDFTY